MQRASTGCTEWPTEAGQGHMPRIPGQHGAPSGPSGPQQVGPSHRARGEARVPATTAPGSQTGVWGHVPPRPPPATVQEGSCDGVEGSQWCQPAGVGAPWALSCPDSKGLGQGGEGGEATCRGGGESSIVMERTGSHRGEV